MSDPRRWLRSVEPTPTDDEVAAILAAIVSITGQPAPGQDDPRQGLDDWVRATRRSARGVAVQRGGWRAAGRVPRRTR